MPIDDGFLDERIAATKADIVIWENADQAIGANGIQEYWIDTGQNELKRKTVDAAEYRRHLDNLYNRLATQCARREGASVTVVPAW